jgi:soluble cytochrome b562
MSRGCAEFRNFRERKTHNTLYPKMKLHRLFVPALVAIAFTIPAMAEEDTPLTKEMEKLSKALKVVNRNLADASAKDANLAKIADAKKAVEAAVKLEPAMAASVPAGEKAKFVADYQASMEATSKALDELKAAVEAGKADEAAKIMEKLNGQKKEGHKKFQKEE